MDSSAAQTSVSSSGTHYRIHGNGGPVLVLIHGFGLDQGMWRWQIDALSQHYTVLTFDLIGMGQSSPPTETPSLTMFSNQLVNLLNELCIEQAAVAGFSLGGMIARRFAMDFAHRIWALAILNSAHKRHPAAHDAIQSRVDQARIDGPEATVDAALSRWFTPPFHDTNPNIMKWVRTTILANDKKIYPDNYQVLVDGVNELIAPAPPISCPTLVMTAEDDYGNSPEMSQAITAEISGSTRVVLPGLRHMAMVEAPELFNEHLLGFLKQVNAGLADD
ncbi:MAG: pimeloyl-ACP methyl ester carboxylesterase [Granulosicoccus sp.]|jgi:pimeloyl-ACP methyl ester carboxylesterase